MIYESAARQKSKPKQAKASQSKPKQAKASQSKPKTNSLTARREDTTMDMFDLGTFPLTAGFTIPNARLAYTTHGTLNPAKDNAVVFPNFLGGSDQALEFYIGNDLALDPRKYFIVLPGQLGNGFSIVAEQHPAAVRPRRLSADPCGRRRNRAAPPADRAFRHHRAAARPRLVDRSDADL